LPPSVNKSPVCSGYLTRWSKSKTHRQNANTAFIGLRVTLTIMPLTKAFAEFQRGGGVTAADWQDWLDGYRCSIRHSGANASCAWLLIRSLRCPVDDEPEYDEDDEERDYDDEKEG
jgi:hypothetical protein